jgi:hypothetical protein
MPWYHNRWYVGWVIFFTIGGLFVRFNSPPFPWWFIVGAFLVFPLLIFPESIADNLERACRRPNPPSPERLQLFEWGGWAFIGFGISAVLRSLVLRENIAVQFLPIGFGLSIALGWEHFRRTQDKDKRD